MKANLIAISVDRGMFPPAAFLATRLASLNPRSDVDIAILSDAEDELEKARQYGVPAELIATKLPLEMDSPATQRITAGAFHRLFITDFVDDTVRRIIYLDADVYVEDDKLFRLFDLEMGKFPIAGVRDIRLIYTAKETYLASEFEKARVSADRFLNGGVLLIDRDKYAKAKIGPRAFNLTVKYHYRVDLVMNRVLNGNWLQLSPVMNAPMELRPIVVAQGFDPVITHFIGPTKPWHGPKFGIDHPARKETEAYLLKSPWSHFLAKHYSFRNAWDSLQSKRQGATFARPIAPKTFKLPDTFDNERRDGLTSYLCHTEFADVEQGITEKRLGRKEAGT